MRMKRWFLLLVLIVVIGTGRPFAQKPTTIEGQLVDGYCYLLDSNYSGAGVDDHDSKKKCGLLCLQQGNPAGVLTKDKKFYIIAGSSISLSKYIGQTVRVRGPVSDGSIIVANRVEANRNGTWERVKLAKMM